jgi:hypothetical protein
MFYIDTRNTEGIDKSQIINISNIQSQHEDYKRRKSK